MKKMSVSPRIQPVLLSVFVMLWLIAGTQCYGQTDCNDLNFLGSSERSTIKDVEIGPDDSVYMVGNTSADVNVSMNGGSETVPFESHGFYVAKYDSNKDLLWVKNVQSNVDINATSIQLSNNQIVVGGDYCGSVDFDPGPEEEISLCVGFPNAFVLALNLEGSYLWHWSFGSPEGGQGVNDVAIAENDDILLVGSFSGTVDLNPSLSSEVIWSTTGAGDVDGFAVLLSNSGEYLWSSTQQGLGFQSISAACKWENDWILVGFSPSEFNYVVDGTEAYIQEEFSAPGLDSFILTIDSFGLLESDALYGSEGDGIFTDVAYRPAADLIYVSGYCSGAGDYASGPEVSSPELFGGRDAIVACYDTSLQLVWLRTFGGSADDAAVSVDLSPNNGIEVAGYFAGSLNASSGLDTDFQVQSTGYPFSVQPDALHVRFNWEGLVEDVNIFGAQDLDRFEVVRNSGDALILGGNTHVDSVGPDCEIQYDGVSEDYQGFVFWGAFDTGVEHESLDMVSFYSLSTVGQRYIISSKVSGQLRVYDLSGRLIESAEIAPGENSILAESWPGGMYVFKLELPMSGEVAFGVKVVSVW